MFQDVCSSFRKQLTWHEASGSHVLFILKMTGHLLIFLCDGCGILLSEVAVLDIRSMTGYRSASSMLMLLEDLN